MDLQRLASELNEAPDLFDPVFRIFAAIKAVPEVISTEADIDLISLALVTGSGSSHAVFDNKILLTNVNGMISHANIARPFLKYDDGDFFV